MIRWWSIALVSLLAACHPKGTAMKPQDAAHWLKQACGVTFSQDPVVLPDTSVIPSGRSGAAVVASATVVLPAAEVESALASLRNNRLLHQRGQSDSRYSYESFPDDRPGTACELDTSLHVLYFTYME
jgi:hypothetical protein